ncbi:hypothetical protein L1049_022711 [Liquidambar formosana]|uniref:Protein SLOW GREEN 1, chloroplastic n=1 Tax=Liquidambar formosana TaxID=63359 RepID=A0AAP0RER4_LIQFO
MDSALATLSSPSSLFHFKNPSFTTPSNPRLSTLKPLNSPSIPSLRGTVSCSYNPNGRHKNPILRIIKTTAGAVILTAAAASMIGKFHASPARAESPATSLAEQTPILEDKPAEESSSSSSSPLSEFLESNTEAVNALKSLLQEKLENGEDEEALKICARLVSAQPAVTEWKFLMARLLNEMGQTENARNVFEEILKVNPLSFEALFENALLMDRCGEGEAVIQRLEQAFKVAEDENKAKEARDVKLIMAQIQFLQKNVEEALRSYEELEKEDPTDFRPYFCRGMIYSLMDRNVEAREQLAKYRELSPKKFEVEGFLRTPLSRMKLFGTDDGQN